MIAYNKVDLEQTLLAEEALNLKEAGFINEDQYHLIASELPGLKKQKSILIRVGLFLIGLILCLSISGVVFLFSYKEMSGDGFAFGFVAFFLAIVYILGLEFLIRTKKYFGYGLDDAFLVSSQLAVAGGIFVIIDSMDTINEWLVWYEMIGVTIVATFFAIRYLNALSTLVACMSFTAVVAYWLIEGSVGLGLAAGIMMIFAALLVFVFRYLKKGMSNSFHLKNIQVALYYSYVLFYLTGNLWVISHFAYIEKEMAMTYESSLGYFYWVFMFVVPVLYILYALKQKDKGLLWTGGAALAMSFYNLAMYTYFLSGAMWLALGGLALFGATFWAIRKIKNKENGLTFQPDRLNDDPSFIDAEALIVITQLGVKPESTAEAPMKFGGGGFSGGGAGESF